jgi:tetratricopeptide (TPR) repeat protein
MTEKEEIEPMGTADFRFWTPPPGRTIAVGPEQQAIPLPTVPLPIRRHDLEGGAPDDNAIGQGVYDYLRQFPDARHNRQYAELLRDAYPHYLADLGAQVAMLEHKEVDAFYVRRKLTGMKILALLDPENPGLWQQMGMISYELALTFSELAFCRQHLLNAMGFLQRALKLRPQSPATLNYLAQIDFYFGDYPTAAQRWGEIVKELGDIPASHALAAKIRRIEEGKVPDHSLVDDLEAVGSAMEHCGAGDYPAALRILEHLEEEGSLPGECPMPEFFYLLGLCRGKTGEAAGAFEAFEKALVLDPEYTPALQGKETVLEGGQF